MTVVIDGTYLSAASAPVFENSVGTLEDSSVRQEGDDGTVQVIGRWPRRRRKWQLTWGTAQVDLIESLFEVCGHVYGFLWVPPRLRDYACTGEALGTGDGTTTQFQLKKTVSTFDLAAGVVRSVSWDIHYPLVDSASPPRDQGDVIHVYLDAVETADWTLGANGLITLLSAPAAGVAVTADFQYATPVQWLSDSIDITMLQADRDEVRSATIVEVFT